ncbi:glucosamine-6-phosphate isomerase 2 isoform X1 [Calypte anna]|uniref:glucosamine-6-phosphate isomerase 2 isoform X1 n=1 Tax=Calypte anna TaxID=9244 RepID=UPI0011C36E6C|nr:glucosamine-6-phosphate isomerase 2 isoform X1 [Calypte anna]
MRLVILEDYDQASEWAAKYICNRIIQFKPSQGRYFTLGLPTGSTPLGCYRKLIEYHKNGDLSFKYVKTFNMDEYVGLPRNHPESYHSYMWNNFFKHIDIDPNNAHILDGNAADLQAECDAFEKKIEEAGGIDLFVGGIGPDGHIAFNEPGSSLSSRTRLKTLAMDTILANAKYFDGDLSKVPTMALTVGVGTVMDAREVMILITGAHKAFALYKAIEEGVNHMWTVSAFQQHPRTIFVCDEDATLELRVKTVKYFKEDEILNRIIQSQNLPSWKGSIRIIKSNSCPCVRHSKNHTTCLRASSKRFLNSGRIGAISTSLGRLFHCSVFLISNLNFPQKDLIHISQL